jgi:hypothetical protein
MSSANKPKAVTLWGDGNRVRAKSNLSKRKHRIRQLFDRDDPIDEPN